jgi:hypothetical protein
MATQRVDDVLRGMAPATSVAEVLARARNNPALPMAAPPEACKWKKSIKWIAVAAVVVILLVLYARHKKRLTEQRRITAPAAPALTAAPAAAPAAVPAAAQAAPPADPNFTPLPH